MGVRVESIFSCGTLAVKAVRGDNGKSFKLIILAESRGGGACQYVPPQEIILDEEEDIKSLFFGLKEFLVKTGSV